MKLQGSLNSDDLASRQRATNLQTVSKPDLSPRSKWLAAHVVIVTVIVLVMGIATNLRRHLRFELPSSDHPIQPDEPLYITCMDHHSSYSLNSLIRGLYRELL